ncbi:hypothetical protein D3C78_1305350 [compost metagenome]
MADANGNVFYHVAPTILGEGSIIMPGNWGRVLMLHTQLNPELFREHVFELVRMKYFPEKPSRLNCVFAAETPDEAAQYRAAHQPSGLIYEVCVVDGHFAKHRGHYNFAVKPDYKFAEGFHDLAHRYWSEVPTECIEVVIQAPVQIMRRIG